MRGARIECIDFSNHFFVHFIATNINILEHNALLGLLGGSGSSTSGTLSLERTRSTLRTQHSAGTTEGSLFGFPEKWHRLVRFITDQKYATV